MFDTVLAHVSAAVLTPRSTAISPLAVAAVGGGSGGIVVGGTPSVVAWATTGIRFDELLAASPFPPQYAYTVTGARKRLPRAPDAPAAGRRVRVNGRDVALFRYRTRILALAADCPHGGAPLEVGDIEEFNGTTCICCPRHGFLFDCTSGKSMSPPGAYTMTTYAVRVVEGGVIEVGMGALDKATFSSMDF